MDINITNLIDYVITITPDKIIFNLNNKTIEYPWSKYLSIKRNKEQIGENIIVYFSNLLDKTVEICDLVICCTLPYITTDFYSNNNSITSGSDVYVMYDFSLFHYKSNISKSYITVVIKKDFFFSKKNIYAVIKFYNYTQKYSIYDKIKNTDSNLEMLTLGKKIMSSNLDVGILDFVNKNRNFFAGGIPIFIKCKNPSEDVKYIFGIKHYNRKIINSTLVYKKIKDGLYYLIKLMCDDNKNEEKYSFRIIKKTMCEKCNNKYILPGIFICEHNYNKKIINNLFSYQLFTIDKNDFYNYEDYADRDDFLPDIISSISIIINY